MPHQELVVNGEVWPSATQLTKLLPQDWLWGWYARSVKKNGWAGWLANKEKSEKGMALGTEVHDYLDSWIKCKTTRMSGEAHDLAARLWGVVGETVEEWMCGDTHVQHDKLRIHGSFDAVVRKRRHPELVIGDFKTSFSVDLAHPVQLCIYAMCWNSGHSGKIDVGEIWRIDKETGRVAIDEYRGLKKYVPVVKALKVIYDYTKER